MKPFFISLWVTGFTALFTNMRTLKFKEGKAFLLQGLTYNVWLNLIIVYKTLKKEGRSFRYIHLCEFREKVRQYCINKFVRTTLLSKNIILFENNTYILVKKFGRRTLRESNDSVKQYIYTIKKNWARSVTRAQTL